MAAELNVEFYLDEVLIINWTVVDIDLEAADISAFTSGKLAYRISETPDSTAPLLERIIGDGISIINGASGVSRIAVVTTSQDALEPDRLYYHYGRAELDTGYSIQFAGTVRTLANAFQQLAS